MNISICIVNWNTKALLKNCLNSIKEKTIGMSYEIIVVDNASKDGSAEMVENEFSDILLIRNVNNGFARANNLATKKAKGKYILYLNPDTELITDAITGMYRYLESNKDYGAVGCKLLNKDGSIQYMCARTYHTPLNQFYFLSFISRLFRKSSFFSDADLSYWDHKNNRDIDCLCGACIMVKKEVNDSIKGFNEKYFMYGEDIELCLKIKKDGWKIYYLADESIYHFSKASSSQQRKLFFSLILTYDADLIFIRDNYGFNKALQFSIAVLLGSIVRVSVALIAAIYYKVTLNGSGTRNSLKLLSKYCTLLLWAIKLKKSILPAIEK
jgi:GT2 family glycosyltransferase